MTPRENKTFTGPPLDGAIRRQAEFRSGRTMVDIPNGEIVCWLRLDDIIEELYDVAILPGTRRPMALGLKTDEIRRTISIGEPADR